MSLLWSSCIGSKDANVHFQIEKKASFWVIADAIKQFYQTHGCLPLQGNVPDMKAQSKVYIQLQNLYRAKARKDVEEVLRTVHKSPSGENVDPEEVKLFCKNAAFVKLINAAAADADRLAKTTSKLHWPLIGVLPGMAKERGKTDVFQHPSQRRSWRTTRWPRWL